MTKALRTHNEAEAEIRAALFWYETERVGLGRELWDELQHTLGLISEHPAIGGVVHRVKIHGTARRVPIAPNQTGTWSAKLDIKPALFAAHCAHE